MLAKNPKARLIREKNERVRYFSEQFATEAAKKYASTARELAEDYKRQALDQAVVEMYCGGSRFAERNRNLIERSKASPDWLMLKERHKRRIQSQIDKAKAKGLPESVERSLDEIQRDYERYLEVADLDQAMNVKMKKIFKTKEDRHAKFKLEQSSSSSEDESELALTKMKSHN